MPSRRRHRNLSAEGACDREQPEHEVLSARLAHGPHRHRVLQPRRETGAHRRRRWGRLGPPRRLPSLHRGLLWHRRLGRCLEIQRGVDGEGLRPGVRQSWRSRWRGRRGGRLPRRWPQTDNAGRKRGLGWCRLAHACHWRRCARTVDSRRHLRGCRQGLLQARALRGLGPGAAVRREQPRCSGHLLRGRCDRGSDCGVGEGWRQACGRWLLPVLLPRHQQVRQGWCRAGGLRCSRPRRHPPLRHVCAG
mmetsp:Transcript_90563/g.230393  ORF Transcript_90563/g.230393 Transcript_90563/m.230393 type:complete len:248 (+) Transcript_90563:402-1145(+)